MKQKKLQILLFIALISSCTRIEYEESVLINAPSSTVFSVITDYENWVNVLPELHDEIEIISDIKEGKGVVWRNIGHFKGHKNISEVTVTEYRKNELVVMEDLKDGRSHTTLTTKDVGENSTLYTYKISVDMYIPYKDDFLEIIANELQLIKIESEKVYMNNWFSLTVITYIWSDIPSFYTTLFVRSSIIIIY